MEKSNHFDSFGNAIMVDVSEKKSNIRIATAVGKIKLNEKAFSAVENANVGKGDVLGVARIAGIMAVKKTSELIPLCHPLLTEKISIDFNLNKNGFYIETICTVKITGKTGVEMEALIGANTALLTIYDMCKAIDKSMVIFDVKLKEKIGGKSGHYLAKD